MANEKTIAKKQAQVDELAKVLNEVEFICQILLLSDV